MNKPLLAVITGRPASGKTTLAHILSQEIKCPLLSRDELKEGYVNTLGAAHSQLDYAANRHIYDVFFETIDLLISQRVSIIIEAAFQNKLWKPKLLGLENRADVKIIICKTALEVARQRFECRRINDPGREYFHGDSALSLLKGQEALMTDAYEQVSMTVPTLEVDTTEDYHPHIKAIASFILQNRHKQP